MIRKISIFIFLFLLLGLGQQANSCEAQMNDFSNKASLPRLDVITAEDLTWIAVSISQGNEYTLLDTTSGDTFTYSITDSLITIQENVSDNCFAGVYTTVPVTNDHLAFSCEMRVTANHSDARNGIIKLYDPISYRRLDVSPIVHYRRDNSLDSGYNYFGIDHTIVDYDEVIIFIYYSDVWSDNLNQTIYVKDFQVHTDGKLPLTSEKATVEDMDIFSWTNVSTDNYASSLLNPPLIDIGETDFNFEVNATYLHVEEINSGTYDAYCGVYVTIPVVNDTATFSFEGKSKSNSVDVTPNLKMAIYDPANSEMLQGIPDIGCWSENLTETEFTYFEFSLSAPNYTLVNLFFFYNDVSALNDQHEFWVRNFKTYTELSEDPEPTWTAFPPLHVLIIGLSFMILIIYSRKKKF